MCAIRSWPELERAKSQKVLTPIGEAFFEGGVAYLEGEPPTANPYATVSKMGKEWLSGWEFTAIYQSGRECNAD